MQLESTPPLGYCIPPRTPHALLNSLPTWEDNIAICMGNAPKINKETSYPRFCIHPDINKLVASLSTALGIKENERCFLFLSSSQANEFHDYVSLNFPCASCIIRDATAVACAPPGQPIFAALFTAEFRGAMRFYTFSGNGISPRLAEVCLKRQAGATDTPVVLPQPVGHCYGDYYVRNTPLTSASDAKRVLRARFAGIVGSESIRGVLGTSADDVYLYSSGMQAIWRSHKLLAATIGCNFSAKRKVAHINLLYCDTYKFLDLPDGTGYHFFTDDALDELEALLQTGTQEDPAVFAIYTDIPGNPHLRTVNLPKLYQLAQCYNVPLVIDETVGGFLNVQILPYCDVVVSSLSKLFSGNANVLGGATLLNPASRFYQIFKTHLEKTYEDTLFSHDALLLEMNSREYVQRTTVINRNTERLADMLYPLSQAGGVTTSVLKAVHYPKYRSTDNYNLLRTPPDVALKAGLPEGKTGYGGLLSVTFATLPAAKAFYGALECYKASTLGTVFTLATAFCAIAFPPDKMEWIEERGVEESLIRFSVGMEDVETVLECVRKALEVAQEVE
ncbi:PLC-like phosphodiesterase [Mycena kentingensis (nom. inval.)]|nr:PLC-like phosphodiesterase [Mycena kentingensis (nom. inval.)]